MAQFYGNKEIVAKYRGDKLIAATIKIVAMSARAVYNSVSSCFGSGAWRNDKPWSNKEAWRN